MKAIMCALQAWISKIVSMRMRAFMGNIREQLLKVRMRDAILWCRCITCYQCVDVFGKQFYHTHKYIFIMYKVIVLFKNHYLDESIGR